MRLSSTSPSQTEKESAAANAAVMVTAVDTATLPVAFNDSTVADAIADLGSTVAAVAASSRANITIDLEFTGNDSSDVTRGKESDATEFPALNTTINGPSFKSWHDRHDNSTIHF